LLLVANLGLPPGEEVVGDVVVVADDTLPFVTFSLLSSTVGSLPKWLKVLGETRSISLGTGVLVSVVVVVEIIVEDKEAEERGLGVG
jgi:hypothetical protein